jgi:hypothetical protein
MRDVTKARMMARAENDRVKINGLALRSRLFARDFNVDHTRALDTYCTERVD